MKSIKISFIFSLICVAIACGGPGASNTQNSVASNSQPANSATPVSTPVDQLAMGRDLYEQNCAICHKEDGTGGKVTIEDKTLNVDDLTSDKIKKFSDEKITGYIVNGVEDEGMPAFKDKLTEAQIREIVTYVRQGIQKMPAEPAKPTS